MSNKCKKCGNKDNYNFAINNGLCNSCIEAELEQLQAKITKAIADIETAELGEGYEYNLREIIEDLKSE